MKICISGLTGSGKTTLGRELAGDLGVAHVEHTYKSFTRGSSGLFAALRGMSAREIKDFDRSIVRMAEGRDCVVTTWYGPWIIKDATLRVWLYSDMKTRARRISERDGKGLAYCERYIKEKDKLTLEQYRRAYGKDFDYSMIDVQVNYGKVTREEAIALISMLALARSKRVS